MAKRRSNDAPPLRLRLRTPGPGLVAALCLLAAGLALATWLASNKNGPPATLSIGVGPPPGDERKFFAQYGGSVSCQSCHEEEFNLWKGSHHAMAERKVVPALDQKAFRSELSFGHGLQETLLGWTNGAGWLSSAGLSGHPEAHVAARIIGHEPLRQALVEFPNGRFQASEAAYDPRSHQWFNVFGEERRRPGEWGHWTGRGMNWNFMCASCHNTALRRHYDERSDGYHTTMAEMSVGCEACHGPLAAHNRWQKQFGNSGRKDPTVVRLSRTQALDNCGACHARRTELAEGAMPGNDFLDFYEPVIVDQTERYYADGQVHDEDYEYGSFLGSRMHQRGVVCTDCHNPHSMKTLLPGNWLCLRCHGGGDTNAPVVEPVAHSRHKVFGFGANGQPVTTDLLNYKPGELKETGGECVNCHMPQTVYMQRHWRHDHGFTCPDPLLTKQFGIPNACNRCHRDKDADWALQWCSQWYGSRIERPARRRAQAVARGQRGGPESAAELISLLEHEETPYWRAVAAGLLSPWAARESVAAGLKQALHDTNALVRTAAARALEPGTAGADAGVTEALRRLLTDPVRSVRLASASSLGARLESGEETELLAYLNNQSDQPAGQMQTAIYYFSKNDLAAALKHAETAVAWEPNAAPMRQELAVILSALNRPREAAAQLTEACRLAPTDAESHYKLALAVNELGDLNRAAVELSKTVELEPRHADGWYNLGLAQSALGEPEQALGSLSRAESLTPDVARIPYARGTILARLHRIPEAKAAGRRALALNPSFTEARELLQSLGD